jgi:hypothetical protein
MEYNKRSMAKREWKWTAAKELVGHVLAQSDHSGVEISKRASIAESNLFSTNSEPSSYPSPKTEQFPQRRKTVQFCSIRANFDQKNRPESPHQTQIEHLTEHPIQAETKALKMHAENPPEGPVEDPELAEGSLPKRAKPRGACGTP